MATVILPTTLRNLAGGDAGHRIDGRTVGEVLAALEARHPRLAGWVLDERRRLRQHVSVFVGPRRAGLDDAVEPGDQVYVVQAISGGAPDEAELLAGTKKGLIVLRGERGAALRPVHRAFPGQSVDYAVRDPRTGTYYAAITHGQYGPHLYLTGDVTGDWQEAEGPAFPAGADAAVSSIWVITPGEEDGVLWAGVAPAALFESRDGGRSWALVEGLWNVPGRDAWEGGAGGLCLHSICPWPGDPSRLAVAISAAGVWHTEDGGASWRRGGRGLVARYLPPEARRGATMLCVHNMHRAPRQPATLYMQFHGGVYRSDDDGASWIDVAGGLPSDFGFPLVVDPDDPDRAWVIPLNADEDRVTAGGRVRVYETRDRGASWQERSTGLPQRDAYLTVLRQAFCHDGGQGLYFGTTSGEIFGSADGGRSWRSIARHLPPILALRSAR